MSCVECVKLGFIYGRSELIKVGVEMYMSDLSCYTETVSSVGYELFVRVISECWSLSEKVATVRTLFEYSNMQINESSFGAEKCIIMHFKWNLIESALLFSNLI